MPDTDLSMFTLKERVALVTGGAGLYGRQIAHALAAAGATTVMASRDVAALQAYADELTAAGLDVHARQLDQADDASVQQLRMGGPGRHRSNLVGDAECKVRCLFSRDEADKAERPP